MSCYISFFDKIYYLHETKTNETNGTEAHNTFLWFYLTIINIVFVEMPNGKLQERLGGPGGICYS